MLFYTSINPSFFHYKDRDEIKAVLMRQGELLKNVVGFAGQYRWFLLFLTGFRFSIIYHHRMIH